MVLHQHLIQSHPVVAEAEEGILADQVLTVVLVVAEPVHLAVLVAAVQEQAGKEMLVAADVMVIQVLAAPAAALHLLDLHVLFQMAAPEAVVQHHRFQEFQSHMLAEAEEVAVPTVLAAPEAVAVAVLVVIKVLAAARELHLVLAEEARACQVEQDLMAAPALQELLLSDMSWKLMCA